MREALDDVIAGWFIEAKEQEWVEYRRSRQVHPWERDRYLATF